MKRRQRTFPLIGALVLFASLGIFLPLILAGADIILGKTRYTSICTRCGVQTANDYYFFFDAEIAHSEKVLPVSRKTVLPNCDLISCEHSEVMIGKTVFSICKDGTIANLRRGEPLGDPHFQNPEIRKTYLALAQKNPGEAALYIEQLARSRYRENRNPLSSLHPRILRDPVQNTAHLRDRSASLLSSHEFSLCRAHRDALALCPRRKLAPVSRTPWRWHQ